jgi:hypothetical protein
LYRRHFWRQERCPCIGNRDFMYMIR